REPAVRRRVGLGDGEDGGEGGAVGAAGEPLVRVDHPVIAVEARGRLHEGRIGAGDLGLGEADRRIDLARHQRVEPATLLLGRARRGAGGGGRKGGSMTGPAGGGAPPPPSPRGGRPTPWSRKTKGRTAPPPPPISFGWPSAQSPSRFAASFSRRIVAAASPSS